MNSSGHRLLLDGRLKHRPERLVRVVVALVRLGGAPALVVVHAVHGSIRLTGRLRVPLQSLRRGPSRGGQQPRQLLAGAVDVRSGRDLRNAEDRADLVEREAVLVAQDDRGALVGPKLGERCLERLAELAAFDRVGSGRRGRLVRCDRAT